MPTLLHGADYNYEQWLEYPDVLKEDFRLFKEAGINALSIGIFAWSMLEPREGDYIFGWLDELMERLGAHGINAILATLSGARPAWLSEAYPEVLQMNAAGVRAPHAGRHNHCRTSPVYREKVQAINRKLAERYGNHPALLMWHVSNEYGAGPCHCPLCYGAFQTWLQRRYGSLDALNHAWWNTFWSHRYTAWEQIEPVDPSVHGLMLDWQRFTSDQTLDFFLTESTPLRELTPDTPMTTNFMQPDVGLDYWKFAPHVDVVSWDSYPRWHLGSDAQTALQTAFYHDLHRSYKRQPFMLMESTPSVTNWQGVSRPKRPGLHLLSSLQAVAHGSDTVQYFQWRQGRGGSEKFHGAVVTHLGSEHTRVFREVSEVGERLETLDGVRGADVRAQAAVIYDFENEWALEHAQLPQSEAKNYQERCIAHYGALWRRGVATDIINADTDFSPYQLLVAPMLYMFRPGVAERLEGFVRSGGVLVTTYLSGIVNESDLCFLGGFPAPLRRTLGLWVEETDTFKGPDAQRIAPTGTGAFALPEADCGHYADIVHLESARPLAVYGGEFYGGTPALSVNEHGDGEAYYLATRCDDTFLDALYAGLIEQHELLATPEVLPEGVSVQVRHGDEGAFVFVMNFSGEERTLDLSALEPFGTPQPRKVTLPAYGYEVLQVAEQNAKEGVKLERTSTSTSLD